VITGKALAMLEAESVDDCMLSYCDAYPDACHDKKKKPKKPKKKH